MPWGGQVYWIRTLPWGSAKVMVLVSQIAITVEPARWRFTRNAIPPMLTVPSPGFCGGWFIWCRWLPVVIVPGGGGRVPKRLRARRGFACRWRSVAGWCPYQWTHSAVATTGGVDVLPGSLVADQLGLVQRVERLGQSIVVGIPLRAHRGDRLAVGQSLPIANRPVLHAAVGVMHQARQVSTGSLSLPDGHLQGVQVVLRNVGWGRRGVWV